MATYDTTVRVGTSIDRRGTEVQLMALENQITKKADKIASIMAKMGEMKDVKLPTEEYKEITAQIDKAEQRLNKLVEKQDQMQQEGKTSGAAWDRLIRQIDEAKNEIKYAKGELQDLVDTGKAFTLGQDTEEYAKMGQQMQYLQNELSVLTEKHVRLTAKQRSAADAYKQFKERGQEAFQRIGGLIKKANDNINAFGRRLKETAQKHLPLFRRETERAKTSLSGFSSRLKSLLSGIFIFNVISAGFRQMFASIRDGYKNLYNDNEKFQSSVDNLKASLTTLKNALAAAFSPIVETAIPYIQKLVGWLTEAVNMIGQLIAALTGRKTYTRAIRQTAEASKEAADATDEETDAINRQLSPLDKMNVVTSQKDKDKDKDKGDGSSFGTMFEEVPIDSNILDFAEKIRDILENFFAPLKEAWDREGAFVIESWKYALNEVWELIKDIGRDFLEVWNQPATIDMLADILHIIGDIGLVIGHLARNFREAWNENETGKRILENIRDILAEIIKNIRIAADKTVEWADDLDFGPLLEAFERFTKSLIPLADSLSGVLTDFYTGVILPLGKWTIEKGLPELLDVFTGFNDRVDWVTLRENLKEFWQHLEPFAETVGEGLIQFIEDVSIALADFLNSQEFKDFLTEVETWMDNVTPEDVADALEKIAKGLIGLKLALLGYKAIEGISGVLTTIKTFLSFFGVGGKGATVAKGMEETATAATGLSTALSALAAVAVVSASYKILTGNMEELCAAFGKSTDQGRRLEERYEGLDGAARFAKDGFNTLKNGIEGYGFAADNCVGSGVALEKAMNDIANGAILTDQRMSELQNRFNLTDDDIEMLRQEMLDANPLLREFADNMGFENASAETLEDIAQGFRDIANGAEPTPLALQNMTEEAQNFFAKVTENESTMDTYREKLENIGSVAENASEQLNLTGKSISDGITKGMEEADVDTASQGFFTRIVESIENVFGIHSPAENMKPLGENILLGVVEGFTGNTEQFVTAIQSWFDGAVRPWFTKEKWSGLWENVKNSATEQFKKITAGISTELGNIQNRIQSKLSIIRTNFINVFNGIRNTVINIFNSIKTVITNVMDMISNKIASISGSIGGFGRSSVSSGTSRASHMSAPSFFTAEAAIATLNKVEIPAYATGQVIPRSMKQHLAILGDNSKETEIVSPLSTIKQALREEAISLGLAGGNAGQDINLNLTVKCGEHDLLHILQKIDREYLKQHGKHAFA